jgi:tight adherence protein B
MRRALLLGLVLLVSLGVGPGAAAQTEDETSEPTEEAGTKAFDGEIQILSVQEIDGEAEGGGGRVVIQLAVPPSIGQLAPTEENFGITDDGRLINNFTVSAVTTAVDVVVALDTSGSMQGEKLAAAKGAASTFIQELPDSARAGLVSFDDTVTVHQQPGADRQAILDDIAALEATTGETSLWDGLITSAREVVGADLPLVVVLSDGEDTVSEATQSRAIDAFRNTGVTLYAVAIESSSTDLLTLEQTAAQVGGQFFDTQNLAELEALYSDIAGRLASRYELAYPTDRTYERDVVVSVAAEGTIGAFASVSIGSGAPEAPPESSPNTPQVLNVPDDARLGLVPAPTPGALGGAGVIWIGAGLMFAALAIFGLLVAWPSREIRLNTAVGADRVAGVNSRLSMVADRLIAARDEEGTLDKALDAAGVNLRPGEYLVMSSALVLGVAIVGSLVGGAVLAIVLSLLMAMSVFIYLSVRADRRRTRFADQLVDTLGIMGGGLRSGRGLPQAIELVAQEAPEPTAGQFQRVVFEARVGRDMTESLLSMADRMQSEDMVWVARAIDINRELGGDLTETLDNVAATIRDRRRVQRQIKALSSEGRASGWVMLALPPLMFLFLAWRTPENASMMLEHPLGRLMLAGAIGGMLVGHFWIRRLVRMKY